MQLRLDLNISTFVLRFEWNHWLSKNTKKRCEKKKVLKINECIFVQKLSQYMLAIQKLLPISIQNYRADPSPYKSTKTFPIKLFI